MSAGATLDLKASTTKLLRIDLDAKVCRRYSGREETHGFAFETEGKITRELVGEMLKNPDQVGAAEEEAFT